ESRARGADVRRSSDRGRCRLEHKYARHAPRDRSATSKATCGRRSWHRYLRSAPVAAIAHSNMTAAAWFFPRVARGKRSATTYPNHRRAIVRFRTQRVRSRAATTPERRRCFAAKAETPGTDVRSGRHHSAVPGRHSGRGRERVLEMYIRAVSPPHTTYR